MANDRAGYERHQRQLARQEKREAKRARKEEHRAEKQERAPEQFPSHWPLDGVPAEFHGVARVLSRQVPGDGSQPA